MRILITGGNGYLGSNLVKKIVEEGHTAVLLILKGTSTKMFSRIK